jgi:hypothetical protein
MERIGHVSILVKFLPEFKAVVASAQQAFPMCFGRQVEIKTGFGSRSPQEEAGIYIIIGWSAQADIISANIIASDHFHWASITIGYVLLNLLDQLPITRSDCFWAHRTRP